MGVVALTLRELSKTVITGGVMSAATALLVADAVLVVDAHTEVADRQTV